MDIIGTAFFYLHLSVMRLIVDLRLSAECMGRASNIRCFPKRILHHSFFMMRSNKQE